MSISGPKGSFVRRAAWRVAAWKRKSLTACDPKTVVSDPERALSLAKLLPRALASTKPLVLNASPDSLLFVKA